MKQIFFLILSFFVSATFAEQCPDIQSIQYDPSRALYYIDTTKSAYPYQSLPGQSFHPVVQFLNVTGHLISMGKNKPSVLQVDSCNYLLSNLDPNHPLSMHRIPDSQIYANYDLTQWKKQKNDQLSCNISLEKCSFSFPITPFTKTPSSHH